MSTLKFVSWNINSVRIRLHLIEQLVMAEDPDIICLQETKVRDSQFPHEAFEGMGYKYRILNGQPMHHGVAIVSRVPLTEDRRHDWQDNGEARHIGVRLPSGLLLENVYIPAGGDVPDREENPKFGQKLDFYERMTKWSETLDTPTIMMGDFNIAPLESDVWSHKQLLKVVSHTPIEVDTMKRLQDAHGWVDVGRLMIPAPERLYTWWSYRAKDWTKGDRGRRLDHVWVSPELRSKIRAHRVLEPARSWEKPSDHIPLITEMEV
ncbi:exodeoxyribonuclease III [Pacificimonas sp. WHA3]|uniref:Exodeoxyribonuclease III n=1 Tax=Pacificimonas pallii TaxID=2827236 RepID=A0ABS6SCF3_9SPHN|nr:exodeoxyribonuclease III [Pacificimonas pallii]MBV7256103.1 exodeoxyribonuclease III [Pacificimonas pallii]